LRSSKLLTWSKSHAFWCRNLKISDRSPRRRAGCFFYFLHVHIYKCTSIFKHYGISIIRDIKTSTDKRILKIDKHFLTIQILTLFNMTKQEMHFKLNVLLIIIRIISLSTNENFVFTKACLNKWIQLQQITR